MFGHCVGDTVSRTVGDTTEAFLLRFQHTAAGNIHAYIVLLLNAISCRGY